MTERQLAQDSLLPPERFPTDGEMIALHTRMALGGEALNPNNRNLPPITDEQLTNLNQTVAIAAIGSTAERVSYWKKRWQEIINKDANLSQLDEQKKFEKQMEIWVAEMVSIFKDPKNRNFINRLSQRMIGGINLNGFNEQTAQRIYQRYFTSQEQGETTTVTITTETGQEKVCIPSNLNQFIDDIIAAYNNNYDEIVADLDIIQWFAGIFGSSNQEEEPKQIHANQVIRELIHTRIKLADQQRMQKLINQANESKIIDGQITSRINWLNPTEETCLNWLYQTSRLKRELDSRQSTSPPQTAETIPPLKWEYVKFEPDKPRKLPEPNPLNYIAKILVETYPSLAEQGSPLQIVKAIEKEIEENYRALEEKGINMDEFGRWIVGQLSEVHPTFPQYLKNKYGIKIPSYEDKIQIIPISGKMAKIINPNGALAFVNPLTPGLFLDLEIIDNAAKRLAYQEGWRRIPQSEFNQFLKRVFSEVSPHELVHLFSDLAYWKKQSLSQLAKLGLLVSKPVKKQEENDSTSVTFWIRGTELDEAVTEEIIARWATDNNAVIDMPNIYQQEREVLIELIKIVSQEKGMSEEETFRYFARSLFTSEDFRRLIELLDGHVKTPNGKYITKRPHFTSILYFLMDCEAKKIEEKLKQGEQNVHYDLTLGFIRNNLTQDQKKEIKRLLETSPHYALPPAARRQLIEETV